MGAKTLKLKVRNYSNFTTIESRYNAVFWVQKTGRVISGSRYSGTTVLPLMDNTLGLYGHAIRGCGESYVPDITLYLLQMSGINNELEIYNNKFIIYWQN